MIKFTKVKLAEDATEEDRNLYEYYYRSIRQDVRRYKRDYELTKSDHWLDQLAFVLSDKCHLSKESVKHISDGSIDIAETDDYDNECLDNLNHEGFFDSLETSSKQTEFMEDD